MKYLDRIVLYDSAGYYMLYLFLFVLAITEGIRFQGGCFWLHKDHHFPLCSSKVFFLREESETCTCRSRKRWDSSFFKQEKPIFNVTAHFYTVFKDILFNSIWLVAFLALNPLVRRCLLCVHANSLFPQVFTFFLCGFSWDRLFIFHRCILFFSQEQIVVQIDFHS